jgi:hypothetical protein
MTALTANPSTISAESRCAHRFANGKRCRMFAQPGSTVCSRHAADTAADLAGTLTTGLGQFTSAEPINQFLSRLLLLLAQDRISPRRGAVMAYTANLLLRSVTVMQHDAAEAERDAKNRPVQIIWDIPRPDREPKQPAPCEQPA